jgi:positive regulator of sigma E activity
LIKKGVVIDFKDNFVTVKVEECSSCGNCTLCSSGKIKQNMMTFKTNFDLKRGDFISFEVPYINVFQFALSIYIFPIIFFFSGFIASSFIFKNEGIQIMFSFISLILYFFILFIFDFYKGNKFAPKILSIIKV